MSLNEEVIFNMAINHIRFSAEAEPEILEVVNQLAELEGRRPHDSLKRLILERGGLRIKELLSGKAIPCPQGDT